MTIKTLTAPDGDKLVIKAHPGGLMIITEQALTKAIVRNIDPAELIAAIREVAGMDDAPEPDPAREYTEEDFAQAEFARHEDGRIAARLDSDCPPWAIQHPAQVWDWLSDTEMVEEGWQIVTPAPTTIQGCVDLIKSLAYEPEDERIPKGTGLVEVWSDGKVFVVPEGYNCEVPVRGTRFRRLLIEPPAPKRPEGAEELEAVLRDFAIYDSDGCEYPERLADLLSRRGVRVES